MTSAKERYRNDPVFHRLVDMLRSLLHGNQATPSELREALMLAVYCEETENPSPVFMRLDLLGRELAADQLADGHRAVTGNEPRRHSPSYSCGADNCLTCAEGRARQDATLLEKCAEARRFFDANHEDPPHGR